jgi:uncharacterized membrane protein YtjA (UPF0391 family)
MTFHCDAAGRPIAGTAPAPFIETDWRSIRMFYWAAVFLVIAIVAAVLGLGGVAGMSQQIAWMLFLAGLVLAAVSFIAGRRRL